MAAPPVRSVSTGTAAGSTSTATYTVSAPAGVANGDLLVAVHTCDESGVAANLTAPTGWTLFFTQAAFQGSVGVLKVWWKVAASEPASYVFGVGSNGSATDGQCAIVAFTTGTYNSSTPLANSAVGGSATATTSMAAPSVTGVVDAQLLCAYVNNGGSVTFAPPSGMTERADFASAGSWTSLEVASLALTSTAATGSRTATASASHPYVSASLLVQPVAAGGSSAATSAGTITLGGAATGAPTPAPTPAPVVALPPIIATGARWSWAMGPWSGLPTLALANATKRSMKLRLTGTSSVTWDLEGSTPEAAAMQELITDVWCIRNGFTLCRARLGGSTHTADGTTYSISYTAGDYRALLQRRQLWDSDTLTYTTAEQSAIAWGLLSSTQGQPGGGLNLTNNATATGTARTITYPAGQAVGQAIEQLSIMDGGFNWDIVPTTGQVGQAFTVWPSRGVAAEVVVDYPGRIAKLTRTVDPGSYANAVRETGNTGLAAVRQEAADIATRAEGRWDVGLGDTSLLDAASVASRATYDLASRQQITPTYTVTLQPGSWGGPPDIWLGDSVLLAVNAGPVQTAVNLRVYEIDIDLDESDVETVTLTLSGLDPFKRARARQLEFRLTQLERR